MSDAYAKRYVNCLKQTRSSKKQNENKMVEELCRDLCSNARLGKIDPVRVYRLRLRLELIG